MPRLGTGHTNRKRHKLACLMCGAHFQCARPDGKTCSNLCRSFLRRWVAKWGAEPISPPGRGNLLPRYFNREAFVRAYVNVAAFERLKAAKKVGRGKK